MRKDEQEAENNYPQPRQHRKFGGEKKYKKLRPSKWLRAWLKAIKKL